MLFEKPQEGVVAIWEGIRMQLTRALGHDLAEPSWQAVQSIPPAMAGALVWRVEALRPQIPERGTIYLMPIRAISSAEPGTRPLCGHPLPVPGRFRCDPCTLATQFVLGQPLQLVGSPTQRAQSDYLFQRGKAEHG